MVDGHAYAKEAEATSWPIVLLSDYVGYSTRIVMVLGA